MILRVPEGTNLNPNNQLSIIINQSKRHSTSIINQQSTIINPSPCLPRRLVAA
jgi:hypothetical protein